MYYVAEPHGIQQVQTKRDPAVQHTCKVEFEATTIWMILTLWGFPVCDHSKASMTAVAALLNGMGKFSHTHTHTHTYTYNITHGMQTCTHAHTPPTHRQTIQRLTRNGT